MDEKIGIELLKQIIKQEQKNGKDPWRLFINIDYAFISQHFGPLAASWALEQRNLDMQRIINYSLKNPYIKPVIEEVQKTIIQK